MTSTEPATGEGYYAYGTTYTDSSNPGSPRTAEIVVGVTPTAKDAENLASQFISPGAVALANAHVTESGAYAIGDVGVRLVLETVSGGMAKAEYVFRVATAGVLVAVIGPVADEKDVDAQALRFAKREESRLRAASLQPAVVPAAAPTAGPASLPGATTSAEVVTYIVSDMGTLPGFTSASPGGSGPGSGGGPRINSAGQAIGNARGGAHFRAFLWDAGTLTDLGTLGGDDSQASAVSDAGLVVGTSRTANGDEHAFVWQKGSLTDLGTLADAPYSSAVAINEVGQVVGSGYFTAHRGVSHAVLWDQGVIQDLGTLGGALSEATGINDAGQVVGESYLGGSTADAHAFLWQDGLMQDLGTLGGERSSAEAINAHGWVVGQSSTGRFSSTSTGSLGHAFVWNGSTMFDLGTLGGEVSTALSINNAGQIVGYSTLAGTDTNRTHAVLWQQGQIVDLNDLIPDDSGWVLAHANGINDAGQIVGSGEFGGSQHEFLLTPDQGASPQPIGSVRRKPGPPSTPTAVPSVAAPAGPAATGEGLCSESDAIYVKVSIGSIDAVCTRDATSCLVTNDNINFLVLTKVRAGESRDWSLLLKVAPIPPRTAQNQQYDLESGQGSVILTPWSPVGGYWHSIHGSITLSVGGNRVTGRVDADLDGGGSIYSSTTIHGNWSCSIDS